MQTDDTVRTSRRVSLSDIINQLDDAPSRSEQIDILRDLVDEYGPPPEDTPEASGRRPDRHVVSGPSPVHVYTLDGEIIFDFGNPVTLVAFDEEGARALAKDIRHRARALRKRGRK